MGLRATVVVEAKAQYSIALMGNRPTRRIADCANRLYRIARFHGHSRFPQYDGRRQGQGTGGERKASAQSRNTEAIRNAAALRSKIKDGMSEIAATLETMVSNGMRRKFCFKED
jgi:hypothetical protein